jgi:hypothetical protein
MKVIICSILFYYVNFLVYSQDHFNQYFIDQTLRIDYFHTGDAKEEVFTVDKLYKQGAWAGNPKKCIQPFDLGIYIVKVYDAGSDKLIYSKGYNSIFAEYQTIDPAIKGIKRTFHESVLIPYPKKSVLLVIEKRDRYNVPAPVFKLNIDPKDYHIITETFAPETNKVIPTLVSGNAHQCVDVVILGEGYQAKEKAKFNKDLKYYTDKLFSVEPYKSRKHLFNIHGVFSPSEESGTDEPRQGIYKNTRFNSTFNYFDLDRYCLADDNKSIRDVAASVPYDVILIMINKDRYGGGGIYNYQTVFTTGSHWRDYVFLHEFGHGFAGLADEYYSSPVSYVDIYTPGVEPLEPNITALLDTANVKWKKYLSPGIKVPTEWGKAKFDSLNRKMSGIVVERDSVIQKFYKSGASSANIEKITNEYAVKLNNINKEIDSFVDNHPLKNKVGVFEGANYLSKGYYRSSLMSMMHKFQEKDASYGIVNEQAIISTIEYYTK